MPWRKLSREEAQERCQEDNLDPDKIFLCLWCGEFPQSELMEERTEEGKEKEMVLVCPKCGKYGDNFLEKIVPRKLTREEVQAELPDVNLDEDQQCVFCGWRGTEWEVVHKGSTRNPDGYIFQCPSCGSEDVFSRKELAEAAKEREENPQRKRWDDDLED